MLLLFAADSAYSRLAGDGIAVPDPDIPHIVPPHHC